MAATNKKYIKNCTGDGCELERTGAHSKLFSRILFYMLSAAFSGVVVYVFLFSPYLQLNDINISGNQELSENDLKQVIDQSLEGKYLNIIPKNNYLFLSQNRVEKILTQDYKKIRTVTIEKKFPDGLKVFIEERKALLVWCSSEEKCFLIDENGTAYSEADFNSPEISQNHLLEIFDRSGTPVTLGDKILDDDYEKYLISIKDGARALGLELSEQYWVPSKMADEINAKTTHGTELYFSTQFPLESALRTLAVVLKKELSLEKIDDIAYIDLRSENKVFYKLNGEQNVDQQQATDVPKQENDASKKEVKSSDKKK